MSSKDAYRQYAILYVDDEEQALKYFRKGLEREFQILTALNAEEALAILARDANKISVVISDHRMPGRTGVDFLTEVRQRWPGIVRILITAYAGIDNAIEAINAGAIYRYITKPANLKELHAALSGAMEHFLLNQERDMLLRERMAVLQRLVVSDRIRSLSSLAAGVCHHVGNAMMAVSCFLDEMAPGRKASPLAAGAPHGQPSPAVAAPAGKNEGQEVLAQQLWELAQRARHDISSIAQRIAQAAVEPVVAFSDQADVRQLARSVIVEMSAEFPGHRLRIDAGAEMPKIKCDSEAIGRLLKILVNYAAKLSQDGGNVTVTAKEMCVVWGAPGMRLLITGEGEPWSDADVQSLFTPFALSTSDPSDVGIDLLAAFFIAYDHGGDIIVHKGGQNGPGFEIRLPLDPTQARRPQLTEELLPNLMSQANQQRPNAA
jgi:two-component system probable response regulator PhcQ